MRIENVEDVTMNHIKRNWRYKVFRYKDKVYLLDGSTYPFSFLSISTKWILPMNAYEVNEEIIEELEEEASGDVKKVSWNGTFIIVFISGLIAAFFDRIIHKLNFGENYNIVFLYAIPIIYLTYFIVSRHLNKKKILRLLNGRYNKKRIRFKLSPGKRIRKKMRFTLLGLVVFILGGILYSGYCILEKSYDSRDYLIYFLVFFIWFLFTVYTAIRPEFLLGATVIVEDK